MIKITVVGAGMAGLLAAAMLRNECSVVHEKIEALPNSHSAVLRFRSSIVSDVLNIPFKKVQVMKAAQVWRNPVADAMAYSQKTNGTSSLRSITTANGAVSTRYIAPPDLIQQMSDRVQADIVFGSEVNLDSFILPAISTVPMPVLMERLGWEDKPKFRYVDGINISADVADADAYFSLYNPNPNFIESRVSLTGNKMIIECPGISKLLGVEALVNRVADDCGICGGRLSNIIVKEQKYAKILPIDDDVRKRFILWATEKHNIYSLGRFATWRPGLLLDDVVNDVRVIHRLINGGTAYRHKKGG